jgi:ATP-dependent RNA helicase DeaD
VAWGTAVNDASVIVATAPDLLEAVRDSSLKLEDVEAVVIDGASVIFDLGASEPIDALLDLVPRDAQRVLFSPTLPPLVEDLIERRVKRALRYPVEPALSTTPRAAEGRIGYVIAKDQLKLDLLASQLANREPGSPPPLLFCRNDERAAELAEDLSVRGFVVGPVDDGEADVAIAAGGVTRAELLEELSEAPGQTISYDVPPDAPTLRARHAGDDDAVILVEPREVAHLREIAAQAKLQARSTPLRAKAGAAAAGLEAFRSELRAAIESEDLTAQLLVLEPLLEEFSATEVAAAAAALLRSRRPPAPAAAASVPMPQKVPAAEPSAPSGPAPATWTRLFVSIGSRDDVRAGDLVGALAGEANIPGARIGKIEIRDTFSIVEIQSDVADQVIRAVNGTTIKGRSVRVDYDRGGPAKRPPAPGRPLRRASGRPPRN